MNASYQEELVRLFADLEGECVVVSFRDGSVYDLKILSAMHGREGSDCVADVRQTLRSAGEPSTRWSEAAMNFRLEDVARVERQNECVFRRAAA
jgi:hypothetical protein